MLAKSIVVDTDVLESIVANAPYAFARREQILYGISRKWLGGRIVNVNGVSDRF